MPCLAPSLGLGGLFVARGQGTGLVGSRSGLQGQHSLVCFWDGAGRAGELGAGGATTFSPAPVPVAGGPASEMPVTLSPPLKLPFFCLFLNQKGRGGEERKGSPSPGPRLGVWGDRLTLCFGSRVLLTLILHQVRTPVPFPTIYVGSGPQGQLKEWIAWHTNGLERRMGDGGQLLFPSLFHTLFNFLPGLRVPFQR